MTDSPLFEPLRVRSMTLRNRIMMSPMTRARSPQGIPGDDVAGYYRRRAEGGTGLIVTEGVAIDHPAAVDHPSVPHMYGDDALAGWRAVVDGVHAAGAVIVPQLWHVGPLWGAMGGYDRPETAAVEPMRPAGLWGDTGVTSYKEPYLSRAAAPTRPMTDEDIAEVISAFRRAARAAADVGFDGIALHGGHGYLLDSFVWESTNRRTDEWGGDAAARMRFPSEVVRAIRDEIGDELPILYRFSQHKQQDYTARVAHTPDELEVVLGSLSDAGVDVFDASGRRFAEPAFEGSPRSLAGWAKKLTGKPSVAVGSVGLGASLRDSRLKGGEVPTVDNIAEAENRMAQGEFDILSIGRLHLADAAIASTLRAGGPLPQFDRPVHEGSLT